MSSTLAEWGVGKGECGRGISALRTPHSPLRLRERPRQDLNLRHAV